MELSHRQQKLLDAMVDDFDVEFDKGKDESLAGFNEWRARHREAHAKFLEGKQMEIELLRRMAFKKPLTRWVLGFFRVIP